MLKLCKKCFDNPPSDKVGDNGYWPYLFDDDYECPQCGAELVDIDCPVEDYFIIVQTSGDKSFIQAMMELREKDLIENHLKLQQFETQIMQQDKLKYQKEAAQAPYIPRCPNCHSTNIFRISSLARGISVGLAGLCSDLINKSYKCKACGYTW